MAPQFESVAQAQDVTLVMMRSERQPDDADFIAQSNSEGSGNLDEKRELTTLAESEFAGEQFDRQQVQSGAREAVQRSVLTVASIDGIEQQAETRESEVEGQQSPDDRTVSANTLRALVAEQVNRYANRPNIKTISSISAVSDDEAAYLYDWQQQVERVGNANYPEAARSQRLSGSVRVLAGIRKDGSLAYVEIRKSSGYDILDNAAERIVMLAAPFEQLPDTSGADVLEIIRTFRFEVDLDVGNQ
ncbi:energy transducer TonB [Salinibius halmophilus]|uniref:energy transducer TonB n=1 Tax=Salinibius halmophilus TaxID=1853216 RepID=UPI001314ECF7|nr:TonB family protein [Salinibius halmophilus]